MKGKNRIDQGVNDTMIPTVSRYFGRHEALIAATQARPCVYLAYIGIYQNLVWYKYGSTDNIQFRIVAHNLDFETFELIHVETTTQHRLTEKNFEKHTFIQKHKRERQIRGKNKVELLAFPNRNSESELIQILTTVKKNTEEYSSSNALELEKLKSENKREYYKTITDLAKLGWTKEDILDIMQSEI